MKANVTKVAGSKGRSGRWPKLAPSALALGIALASYQPAFAQEDAEASSAESADAGAAEDAIILVTGSRIARTGLDTPMPLTQLDSEAIEFTLESNAVTVIDQLPQTGVGENASTGRNRTQNGAGLAFANLRSLGTDRTLVLINGRRHVGGGFLSSSVDLNSIPSIMIERVDVITGGASSVYGADAVTGVVNFVLKSDFEGFEADAQTSITNEGDGETYTASILAGTNFSDDRGNISFAATYDKSTGVAATARDFGADTFNTYPNPNTAANPNIIPGCGLPSENATCHATGVGFFFATDAGNFWEGGPVGGPRMVLDDGSGIRDFNLGDAPGIANNTGRTLNGDGADFERFDQLRHPVERLAFMVNTNYDVTDALNIFVEAKYARTESGVKFQPVEDPVCCGFLTITRENAFLPADLAQLMDTAGVTELNFFRKIWTQFGPRSTKAERNSVQLVGGLTYELPNDWKLAAHYSYGHTSETTQLLNTRLNDRFFDSLDSILVNGQPVCRDPDARANGCVALNPFGVNTADPAAVEYSRTDAVRFDKLEQQVASISLTGELFDLPGGPVGFAVGGEYRDERGRAQPSELEILSATSQSVPPPGFLPAELPTRGGYDVTEAFGEVRLPILSDVPFAQSLSVEGAIRYADYSTAGGATSWHVAGDWAPSDDIRFRVVRSRAVRAPNIGDLFAPQTEAFFFINDDPCNAARLGLGPNPANRAANCAALGIPPTYVAPTNGMSLNGFVGGNPNLRVEKADTWTVGVVVTPTFLPGFSASIDYWDIKLDDAISGLGAQSIMENCVDLSSIQNLFCDLVTRDPTTFAITSILDVSTNVAQLTTDGLDFEASYNFALDGVPVVSNGTLRLGLQGSYVFSRKFFGNPIDPTEFVEVAGTTFPLPKLRFNARATYENGPFLLSWQARYVGSMRSFDGQLDTEFDIDQVDPRWYHNLYASHEIGENLKIRVGVNNVFDTDPPRVTFGDSGLKQGIRGFGGFYPNLGRTYFVGLNLRL